MVWDDAFGLGLQFMGARHYSPALGRFIQPDPTALEGNAYAYAGSNPTSNVDPTGESWLKALIELIRRFGPGAVAWLGRTIVWRFGPFALTADKLAHIFGKHGQPGIWAPGVTRFLNNNQIIPIIQATLSQGTWTRQGTTYLAELRIPFEIGVTFLGTRLSWVRVVIQGCAWWAVFCSPTILSAYPIRASQVGGR